jgi:hypothetical protein
MTNSNKRLGSLGEFMTNLDTPYPLPKKIWLLIRNLSTRLRGQTCCGHPGEPGC